MANLIIPKVPGDIRSCTSLAWMRMTLDKQPVTGMVVRGEKGDVPVLIYVGKDGVLKESKILVGMRVAFIDYLTQDESVTIFGEATERTEDDIAPVFKTGLDRPVLAPGTHMSVVPDFVPYIMRSGGLESQYIYEVINVPCTKDYDRIGLCFSLYGSEMRREVWSNFHEEEVFERYLDDPSLDRWRKHKLVKSHHVVDPSTWPDI